MKAAALLILTLALAPSLAAISKAAQTEHWTDVALGAALAAVAFWAIRYLLT